MVTQVSLFIKESLSLEGVFQAWLVPFEKPLGSFLLHESLPKPSSQLRMAVHLWAV